MKILFFVAAMLLFTGGVGPPAQAEQPAGETLDQDYVLALATVNRFLCAWQMRRQEEGLAMLSRRLKQSFTEEELRMYISGISNPHHAGFDVGRGKRLADGHFAFPVRFYEHYTAEKETFKRPKALRFVVVQTGPEEWRVEELPGLVKLRKP